MKNIKRIFLLLTLAFLASKVLSSDFEFASKKLQHNSAVVSAE